MKTSILRSAKILYAGLALVVLARSSFRSFAVSPTPTPTNSLAGAATGIPPAEQLLPDDTLVMITVPDWAKLKTIYRASPQGALWNDEAMKPFRDRITSKWKEEFVEPLEHELDIKIESYTSLPQGQVTLALTQHGSSDKDDQSGGMLVLLDTRNQSGLLRTNLADLRRKWVARGKTIRTEKLRGVEFCVLSFSSNDVPATLKKFFPPTAQLQHADSDEDAKATGKSEFVIGQFDSLLIIGNCLPVVEKVVAKLSGGSGPALADQAAFEANREALFRDAPFYVWANVKTFIDAMSRKASEKKTPEPDDPLVPFNSDKIVAATGLGGLKTVAMTLQITAEGSTFQVFVGVPESGRQGLFKILAGESKDSSPPPFIPADAVKFQRWRIDGQKAWAALEKMLTDISPQSVSGLNFLLDTANVAAREKDPNFDVRKNLIGNLGDDIISYEKLPRGGSSAGFASAPALYLVGSPNPEQLVAALKSVLVIMNPQAGEPKEREFLGRKIYALALPSLPLPMADAGHPAGPRALELVASGGYVAMSTDPAVLEEYLRSAENQGKALRDSDGLADAMASVIDPGTSMFGYANQAQTMRAAFDAAAKDPAAVQAAVFTPISNTLIMAGQAVNFKDLVDLSLLPPFDKVAKYFSFTVYSLSANVDGMTFKTFSPVPPGMKAAAAKH